MGNDPPDLSMEHSPMSINEVCQGTNIPTVSHMVMLRCQYPVKGRYLTIQQMADNFVELMEVDVKVLEGTVVQLP